MRTLTLLTGLTLAVFVSLLSRSSATWTGDIVVRTLPVTIRASDNATQYVHLRIRARPSFTFVQHNEAYSYFTTQTVLVRDVRTGDTIATVRQSDSQFVDTYFHVPAEYLDENRRALLTIEGSSPWILTQETAGRATQVISVDSTGTTDRFRSVELMFGKPDDHPFLGERLSYAEGAYLVDSNWFFNKFFRYGNDPSSFRVPIEPDRPAWLRAGFYLSAKAKALLNDREVAVLERSFGTRFFQDHYRWLVESDDLPIQTLTIANVEPFRATPTNLRQMAFAFHSLEITVPQRPDDAPVSLTRTLNTRLDYRHSVGAQAQLLKPRHGTAALLAWQGGAWLPLRDPIPLPPTAKRRVDAIVLLDPVLETIANTGYASGDVWINAAVGAAMMLEHLGYSVAYATPDEVEGLAPSVVYLPSQPFYRNLLTRPLLDRLAARGMTIIVEPSVAGEFLGSPVLPEVSGLQLAERALHYSRSDIRLGGRVVTETFQTTPIFDYRLIDSALVPEAFLTHPDHPIAFGRTFGRGSLKMLAFPAGYTYFNYGLRSHRAILTQLLSTSRGPRVFARASGQARAYLIAEERCVVDVMIENNNVGAFNYYGFAEVSAPRVSASPPPLSRVELAGTLFDGARRWQLAGDRSTDSEGTRPVLHNLAKDTIVRLHDRLCETTETDPASSGSPHPAPPDPAPGSPRRAHR